MREMHNNHRIGATIFQRKTIIPDRKLIKGEGEMNRREKSEN